MDKLTRKMQNGNQFGSATICLFCGEANLRISDSPFDSKKSRANHLMKRKWVIDSIQSVSELLELDSSDTEFQSVLGSADFCSYCYELVADVLFLKNGIQKFEDRLKRIKNRISSLIVTNYERSVKSDEESCPCPYPTPLPTPEESVHMKTLKFLGMQLLRTKSIKTESDQEDPLCYFEDESNVDFPLDSYPVTSMASMSVGPESNLRKRQLDNFSETEEFVNSETDPSVENSSKKNRRVGVCPDFYSDREYINSKLEDKYGTSVVSKIVSGFYPNTNDVTGQKFICSDCTFSSTTQEIYLAHLQEIHRDDSLPFHCQKCPYKGVSRTKLGIHGVRHHEILDLQCDKCSSTLPTWKEYTLHRSTHRNPLLQERCRVCSQRFPPGELTVHEGLHSEKLNPFECVLCELGEDFENQLNLESHVRQVHTLKEICCIFPNCTAKFVTPSGMHNHVKKLHDENPKHICEICNRIQPSPSALKFHLVTHGKKEHRLKCTWPNCCTILKNRRQYTLHVRTVHKGQDPRAFKCNVCQKGFVEKYKLMTHMRIHSDRRDFLCDQCPYAAKTQPNLWNHINITHRMRNSGITTTIRQMAIGFYRSQKARGENQSRTEPTSDPLSYSGATCEICDGISDVTVYNTGTTACKSCFKFYRIHCIKQPEEMKRCIAEDEESNGNCTISCVNAKRNCIPCRFTKCIQMGMAPGIQKTRAETKERKKSEKLTEPDGKEKNTKASKKSTKPRKAKSGDVELETGHRKLAPRGRHAVRRPTASCLICEDETKKYSFGMPICLPCANFSHRALRRNTSFVCKNGGKCIIGKNNRTCSHCRLKKCHSVGFARQREVEISKYGGLLEVESTPCAICGEPCFEKCYGVFSCTGSMQFFGTAIKNGSIYTCQDVGRCEITKDTRGKCRACRLAKCIRVGMNPNGVGNSRKKDKLDTNELQNNSELDSTQLHSTYQFFK